jgi:hypothetical protein
MLGFDISKHVVAQLVKTCCWGHFAGSVNVEHVHKHKL